MSAPDVNLERQKSRHRTMVRGLWIGAAFAVIVAVAIYGYTVISGEDAATVILPTSTDGG